MFKIIVFAACLAYAYAAFGHSSSSSVGDEYHAEIVHLKSDVRKDGYDYNVETSNSIHQHASGDGYGNVHGGYEYVSPEGEHIKVSYVADEYGYHPEGDVLPTPPPVPAAILKAIEYIRAHPPKEEHSRYH
ncbi:larval cuticle protein 2-like [Haematobia irritans]|uniref:larval cuticle protein 2-like n=1 Tax=Haematobia irritans TaxID=7368 RepID=UPI003F50D099